MPDQLLFDIEPIELPEIQATKRSYPKRKKATKTISKPLIEGLQLDVPKKYILVSKKPRTMTRVPAHWTKEECDEYVKIFYDENGKLRCQPAGDIDVFGGMNRQ